MNQLQQPCENNVHIECARNVGVLTFALERWHIATVRCTALFVIHNLVSTHRRFSDFAICFWNARFTGHGYTQSKDLAYRDNERAWAHSELCPNLIELGIWSARERRCCSILELLVPVNISNTFSMINLPCKGQTWEMYINYQGTAVWQQLYRLPFYVGTVFVLVRPPVY